MHPARVMPGAQRRRKRCPRLCGHGAAAGGGAESLQRQASSTAALSSAALGQLLTFLSRAACSALCPGVCELFHLQAACCWCF